MLQRRSTVSLVVITAIAVVVATVAVVYALQTIFQTREVTATVNVVPLGEPLNVCRDSDTNCESTFTGDLNFGNMFVGTSKEAFFRVKNTLTGDLDPSIFFDFRIRFDNVVSSLALTDLPPGVTDFQSGDIPNLGTFRVMGVSLVGFTFVRMTQPLQPQEVRRVRVTYTPHLTLPPGPLNFDLLVDMVDVVD